LETILITQRHHLFSRLGAFVLLLIFLSVPLIETLHHHVNSGNETEVKATFRKDFSKTELSASQLKCKLCDLMWHHSQHACLTDQQTIIFNATFLGTLGWYFILQASSDFILTCANKGPPAIIL